MDDGQRGQDRHQDQRHLPRAAQAQEQGQPLSFPSGGEADLQEGSSPEGIALGPKRGRREWSHVYQVAPPNRPDAEEEAFFSPLPPPQEQPHRIQRHHDQHERSPLRAHSPHLQPWDLGQGAAALNVAAQQQPYSQTAVSGSARGDPQQQQGPPGAAELARHAPVPGRPPPSPPGRPLPPPHDRPLPSPPGGPPPSPHDRPLPSPPDRPSSPPPPQHQQQQRPVGPLWDDPRQAVGQHQPQYQRPLQQEVLPQHLQIRPPYPLEGTQVWEPYYHASLTHTPPALARSPFERRVVPWENLAANPPQALARTPVDRRAVPWENPAAHTSQAFPGNPVERRPVTPQNQAAHTPQAVAGIPVDHRPMTPQNLSVLPPQVLAGNPVDRRPVPAQNLAAQMTYLQHPHYQPVARPHQQFYPVQAYQVVQPFQRSSLPYNNLPDVAPDRGLQGFHTQQPHSIGRSQSERKIATSPDYQIMTAGRLSPAYSQGPQLYVSTGRFAGSAPQLYGLGSQTPRQPLQVQPSLMCSTPDSSSYLISPQPFVSKAAPLFRTGDNAGQLPMDGLDPYRRGWDPYAPKHSPNDSDSSLAVPSRVSNGPKMAAEQHMDSSRTAVMLSAVPTFPAVNLPHAVTSTRKPVVYAALLSRVAEAFEQQIALSTEYKDSLEYRDCFDGRKAVDVLAFIIATTNRKVALLLGRALDAQKLFHDVTWDYCLRDSPNELYTFTNLAALQAAIDARRTAERKGVLLSPVPADLPEGSLPNGVFTMLTSCYSPTCTRKKICYSFTCPRRLEQQARLNLVPKGTVPPGERLRRSSSRGSSNEAKEEQKLWIDTVSKEIADNTSSMEKKRQEVLFELIYTEKDFLRDLETLERLYLWPLRSIAIIPDSRRKDVLGKIFQNVEELKPITAALCDDLQARQNAAPVIDHIGDVFIKHLENFGAFVRYGANQVYSKVALERESADNPEFVKFYHAQERHPDSRKLPIQSFLGRPTTRLGRYKLLLEAVLKFTAEDNQDQADIPAALKKVKSLLSQINVETGINDNRLRLSQLNDRLVLKNDEYRDLKLLDPERVMIREGVLKRADTVELTVFLLDNYLLLTKAKKGKDGQPEYRSHKPPIPLEMILLMEDPSPRLGLRRNSSMLFKPTFGNGGTAANGDADVDLSSVGDGRDGEKSLPAGHSRSLSAEISSGGAKQGYPFSLTRLGKSGGVITLYAKTLAEWRQWKEEIEKQVALLLKRTKIFSMKIVCQQGFAPVNRVLCAAVFGVANRLVVGTDDGLYVNGADEPQSFRRAIELERVSQVEVVEESSSVFALSRGELLSFDLDALEFHESTASKRPQRISSHVTFFRVGECLGRKLVCAVKSTSLSSTVKVMEPVVDSRYKKSTPGFAKLLMRGTNDNLKVFKEFYIPSEATSVDFLRKKLCVGCTKGFEIVDLDSLKTQGFLDPEDENLKFVADRVNVVPITIFRIDDSHFLLCYDLFAFYVDKTGHRAKGNWFIVWEGKPEAFAVLHGHLLAFEPSFIEVRDVHTGQLVQVIRTKDLRFLAAAGTEVVCVTSGATPTHDQIIYRIVPSADNDEEAPALAADAANAAPPAVNDSPSATAAETPFTNEYGKGDREPSIDGPQHRTTFADEDRKGVREPSSGPPRDGTPPATEYDLEPSSGYPHDGMPPADEYGLEPSSGYFHGGTPPADEHGEGDRERWNDGWHEDGTPYADESGKVDWERSNDDSRDWTPAVESGEPSPVASPRQARRVRGNDDPPFTPPPHPPPP